MCHHGREETTPKLPHGGSGRSGTEKLGAGLAGLLVRGCQAGPPGSRPEGFSRWTWPQVSKEAPGLCCDLSPVMGDVQDR